MVASPPESEPSMPSRNVRSRAYQAAAVPESEVMMARSGKRRESSQKTRWFHTGHSFDAVPEVPRAGDQELPFANLPEARSGRWGQGLTKAKMAQCRWLRPELVGQFVRETRFQQEPVATRSRGSRFIGAIRLAGQQDDRDVLGGRSFRSRRVSSRPEIPGTIRSTTTSGCVSQTHANPSSPVCSVSGDPGSSRYSRG
jgi:hypothetical protein